MLSISLEVQIQFNNKEILSAVQDGRGTRKVGSGWPLSVNAEPRHRTQPLQELGDTSP